MTVKTLIKELMEYAPSDSVKVSRDGDLFIGRKGGFLIRMPKAYRLRKEEINANLGCTMRKL